SQRRRAPGADTDPPNRGPVHACRSLSKGGQSLGCGPIRPVPDSTRFSSMTFRTTVLFPVLALGGLMVGSLARGAEPPATSVAEIQAKHDRAFIRELTDYLDKNPRAADRDQAYAALFNKAIEHDWFAETEELGRTYLKVDPDGPVKALAQIILTMA